MKVNLKNILVLSLFLSLTVVLIYSIKNLHLLDRIYKEQEIRVIINGTVIKIPQGSRVKDALEHIHEEYDKLEDLDLERELSDGDFIDLNKGL